jgi:outer membrane protein assembly factor BamD
MMDFISDDKEDNTKAGWSAAEYYNDAKADLDRKNYQNAIETYEALEIRYPFGLYAEQGQIDLAYAYYKTDEPDSALSTAERFIRIHPHHKNIDYVYYLKGLINFNRGIGLLERFLPTDTSQRDSGAAIKSKEDFETLIRRFPDSQYAADSKQRIIALRTNLALYDLNVADYYMRRGAYLAVVNRTQHIIEEYQRTTAVPRALLLMIEAYKKLDMNTLAADAQRVYDLNYPNGLPPLQNPSYASDKTTAEKLWDFFELDK